jgi:electron transfer flavoprotein beta subunit
MRVIVCVKQVPETDQVRIDPERKSLVREGVPMTINPLDEHGLEAGLQLKEGQGAEVIALSMGPPSAAEVLRHALAMGCDQAVLISDPALAGSDTLATARALAAAVRKLGGAELIICGDHSSDGDTGQVGPELAELLGLPQATYAVSLAVAGGRLLVRRRLSGYLETVELPLPALVTVLQEVGKPRRPSLRGLKQARQAPLTTWTLADLGLAAGEVGLAGSPTRVLALYQPPRRPGARKLEVSAAEAAQQIAALLSEGGAA